MKVIITGTIRPGYPRAEKSFQNAEVHVLALSCFQCFLSPRCSEFFCFIYAAGASLPIHVRPFVDSLPQAY
jgi:hypothetical protein